MNGSDVLREIYHIKNQLIEKYKPEKIILHFDFATEIKY